MPNISKIKLNNTDFEIEAEYSNSTQALIKTETSSVVPSVQTGDSPLVTEYYIIKKLDAREDEDSLYIYLS